MVYQSFNNEKNKINKSWNRIETTTDDLKNISFTTVNFNSINTNKKILTYPIIENEESMGDFLVNATIYLQDFPEWAINMMEPTAIYTVGDGYAEHFLDISLNEAFENGTLKSGDVGIGQQEFKYWFNRIDHNHFLLKIFYTISVIQVGLTGGLIPILINMSLKIYNQRNYEKMNEKFE